MFLFRTSISLTHAVAVVAAPLRALVPIAGLAVLAFTTISAPAAHAQAEVTFTGGNGAPIVFHLNSPVIYTLNEGTFHPVFLVDKVGNFLNGQGIYESTITYTVNNGRPVSLNRLGTGAAMGFTYGDDHPDDIFIYSTAGPAVTVKAGNVITVNPGTITLKNYVGRVPADGAFNTFIVAFFGGKQISSDGIAGFAPAPEPDAVAGKGGRRRKARHLADLPKESLSKQQR